MAQLIRLQKYFTDCGIMSRRAAEQEIAAGHVKVNGVIALIGDKIDSEADTVEWNGKHIQKQVDQSMVYLMLNKPRGYVTTSHDEKKRKKVYNVPEIFCENTSSTDNPSRIKITVGKIGQKQKEGVRENEKN